MTSGRRIAALAVATAFAGGLVLDAGAALADPPPWAPAHGWRAKHEYKHKHKRDDWDDDDRPRIVYVPVPTVVERKPAPPLPYGFSRGTCDRGLISSELLGGLLGGAAGGLAGSRFGEGTGKLAAVAGGTLLGVLVGGSIGRSMDAADQACAITALDHLPDSDRIRWSGPRHDYALVPTRTYQSAGRYCRDYTTTAFIGDGRETVSGTACRTPDGAWEIVN